MEFTGPCRIADEFLNLLEGEVVDVDYRSVLVCASAPSTPRARAGARAAEAGRQGSPASAPTSPRTSAGTAASFGHPAWMDMLEHTPEWCRRAAPTEPGCPLERQAAFIPKVSGARLYQEFDEWRQRVQNRHGRDRAQVIVEATACREPARPECPEGVAAADGPYRPFCDATEEDIDMRELWKTLMRDGYFDGDQEQEPLLMLPPERFGQCSKAARAAWRVRGRAHSLGAQARNSRSKGGQQPRQRRATRSGALGRGRPAF